MIENVNNRDILLFEIEKSAVDEKKVIGSFQKNIATIELLNPENKYSNFKNTLISTIKGTFYVDDIESIQENIKIRLKCYDLAYKFDVIYDSSKFVFPITLKEWKEAICEELGIECDTADFPNSSFLLNSSPFIEEKSTYRDVMKMIAQAGSCWVIIDYDNKLKFQWFDEETENEIEDWFELKTDDVSSDAVNVVVLGRGDVEDNVVYPEETPLSPKEIRIDSNEILDTRRKAMIVPIYTQVVGFKYTVFSMKTAGRLNAKVGQKISYLDMYKKSHSSFIMRHVLSFAGGDYTKSYNWISTIEAVELDETNTNYKFAESIEEKTTKTERLANKLDGIINDVVREISNIDGKINEEFTNVYQDLKNVITSVQNSGGSNLIQNSVMFALDNENNPINWEVLGEGNLIINSSTESLNAGGLSGQVFTLLNKKVKQRVYVKPDNDNLTEEEKTYYTFSTKIKKNATGNCYVKISNDNEEYVIELSAGTSAFFSDYEIKALLPKANYYDIEFYGSEDSNATFTDNMFAVGKYKTQWQQANGEIMNTQVNININGVLVKSLVYQGDYTVMSPLEFAGYSNINGTIIKVFSLNKDVTLVKKLEAEDEIKMTPIKIVPITTGDLQGWAFVPSTGGGN